MFEYVILSTFLPAVAFALDMFLGHRETWWRHPVCHIGDLLKYIEPLARNFGARINNVRAAGILCLLFMVSFVGFVVWILTNLPYVGWILTLYFSYSGLATKSLLTFYNEILEKVEDAPLDEAQEAVAQLVSRDTTVLERAELRKTLADTFSENFTDAIVAPLFWLLIAGPVGLWMYKTVSTMDSMWGYKTEPWADLGFAGAKCDDFLAYIPARLSVPILQAANAYENIVQKTGGSWPGWRRIFAQAKGMPSPNSGLPMACAAWLMNARLAGPSVYFGEMVDKPWLGPAANDAKPWDRQKLEHLHTIIQVGAYSALVLLCTSYFGFFTMLLIYG